MKYLGLGLVFLALPLFLLNSYVAPALDDMRNVYQNADSIAQRIAEEQ